MLLNSTDRFFLNFSIMFLNSRISICFFLIEYFSRIFFSIITSMFFFVSLSIVMIAALESCLLVLTSANIWAWFLLILYSWKLITLWFFFFCQKIWIVLWRLKNFGFYYISVRRVDCFRQLGWLGANLLVCSLCFETL